MYFQSSHAIHLPLSFDFKATYPPLSHSLKIHTSLFNTSLKPFHEEFHLYLLRNCAKTNLFSSCDMRRCKVIYFFFIVFDNVRSLDTRGLYCFAP